jgi:hypothetical protein
MQLPHARGVRTCHLRGSLAGPVIYHPGAVQVNLVSVRTAAACTGGLRSHDSPCILRGTTCSYSYGLPSDVDGFPCSRPMRSAAMSLLLALHWRRPLAHLRLQLRVRAMCPMCRGHVWCIIETYRQPATVIAAIPTSPRRIDVSIPILRCEPSTGKPGWWIGYRSSYRLMQRSLHGYRLQVAPLREGTVYCEVGGMC